MHRLRLFLTPLLFAAVVFLGGRVVRDAKVNQTYKIDQSELNHFAYGLLSVNVWKKHLTTILALEIDRFRLDPESKKALRQQMEKYLHILMEKMTQKMVEENLKTTSGKIKQTLIDSFVDLNSVKRGVPEYAAAIVNEMTRPATQAEMKSMIKGRMRQYLKKTFDAYPANYKQEIIERYGGLDEVDTREKLAKLIAEKRADIVRNSVIIIALVVFMFLFEGLHRGPLPPSQFFTLALTLVAVLAIGVTTPMIDLEAKISQLSFVLLNHPIRFEEQVLYFQSKSIMDVFWVMIRHEGFDMKLVGLLMVTFSIVFPLLKLSASLAYYYDYAGSRKRAPVKWFVEKSGKWSMADVLVVAMFMAYIGLNGVVDSQLGKMDATGNPEVFTTNGTSLQPGFFLFFAYSVMAMVFSGLIKSRPLVFTEEIAPPLLEEDDDLASFSYERKEGPPRYSQKSHHQ